jgi:hypothetical protein
VLERDRNVVLAPLREQQRRRCRDIRGPATRRSMGKGADADMESSSMHGGGRGFIFELP